MQTEFPALEAMGVKNPHQINHFSVYQSGHDADVLKIRYARPKGSFLPETRTYNFPRTPKPQDQGGATPEVITVYEVSPQLAAALNELDRIVDQKQSVKEIQKQLSHELDRIQRDFQAEMEGLRQLIKKLDS
ncbi:MAG: DUF3461 family protein [Thiolinea sp.]